MPQPESMMHPILQQLENQLIKVEKGSFWMGSEEGDDYEKPVHQVTFKRDFYISKYPVMQAFWEAVMGENPSHFKGANRPVEQVSWDDTQEFFEKLNRLEGNQFTYRLPTEAEWEYAARGGNRSKGFQYAGSNKLKEVGWFRTDSHDETKVVGLKKANELGFFDMSGNVREWCQDRRHSNYEGTPNDGSPWLEGDILGRIFRGGSWNDDDGYCRVASRLNDNSYLRINDIGFRVSRY